MMLSATSGRAGSLIPTVPTYNNMQRKLRFNEIKYKEGISAIPHAYPRQTTFDSCIVILI